MPLSVGKHLKAGIWSNTLPKCFYEYSIKIHSFFQRENMEELMENKVTEAKKTVQKRMEPKLKLINMDRVEV